MPTYALPPNTRALGTANPGPDMDAVVDVLNHSVYQRTFYLDQYGADPTGAVASDAAWTACYADATAALQTHSGTMIVLGGGYYKFTVGTVIITDARIGLQGAGREVTTIFTTGSSGTLVDITGSNWSQRGSAPVGGFTVHGGSAGAGVSGLRYGDRAIGTLTDVSATSFGGAGGRGFWFQDNTHNSEGSFISVNADSCTVCFDFDQVTPQASGGSFDYSTIYLHIGLFPNGANAVGMRWINGMHSMGSKIHMAGNVAASSASFTATVVQIGVSTSDTAHIGKACLDISVECDNSAGTVTDLFIQGTSAGGILNTTGVMWFPSFGGTYTAGSVSTNAHVLCCGFLQGALFSAHGTLTAVDTHGNLMSYTG